MAIKIKKMLDEQGIPYLDKNVAQGVTEANENMAEEAKVDPVLSLNGNVFRISNFCDGISGASIKESDICGIHDYLEVKLFDNFTKDSVLNTARRFLELYVNPSDKIQVVKRFTEFDYMTDYYNTEHKTDNGTLSELFSRIEEGSNLRLSNNDIGDLQIKCEGKKCEFTFFLYNGISNYTPHLKFITEEEIFPKAEFRIKDKHQQELDAKQRRAYKHSW